MIERDTIFALSSGRPPAAVSVIRITGPAAHDAARLLAGSLPGPRHASLRAFRNPFTDEVLDHGLVLKFDAPASSTGEDMVEIQCHGGRAVVDALLGVMASIEGLRLAESGEFTRRAFENGRIDLTEAEGLADLIEAETQGQRRAAIALADGGLKRQIASWQHEVLALSAVAERAIEYDESDDDIAPGLKEGCNRLALELGEWLCRPRAEPLKEGIRIVIAGPPNSGKSSLLNMIAGTARAIVTEMPGTTRDYIEVPLALAGIPVLLVDTAGLRETRDNVEAIGIARTAELIHRSDILLWLGPADETPDHPRLIAVHSKADLSERKSAPQGSLAVSSVTAEGLTELLERLAIFARALLPAEDAIALNRRQWTQLDEVASALADAALSSDILLIAEDLRSARSSLDRLTGAAGMEDVLDALFARFCLGK